MNVLWSFEGLGVVLGFTALCALVPSCASLAGDSATANTSHRIVEAQVTAFLGHYIKTLEGGDEEAVRSLFVADGRFAWFTDGAQSYSTPDDVLAGMRRYAGIRFETAVSEIHVVPLGAFLASARSKFRTELTIPGGKDHEYGGIITWLLEKPSQSGEWQVISGHTSTPGGLPAEGDKH